MFLLKKTTQEYPQPMTDFPNSRLRVTLRLQISIKGWGGWGSGEVQ